MDITIIFTHVLPAAAAGGAAFAAVRYGLQDHARRIIMLEKKLSWTSRKMVEVVTQHSMNHPDHQITLDDFPDNGP